MEKSYHFEKKISNCFWMIFPLTNRILNHKFHENPNARLLNPNRRVNEILKFMKSITNNEYILVFSV